MRVIVQGRAKEIAALVLAVQGRQKEESRKEEHQHGKYLKSVYKNGRVFYEEAEC